ncbi:methenyltetrahydrofolate synthetase [Calliopsis andreniformis]|uniref:methenyltetrahydrofolate synthetase n=1 Tax=Calliopsis andreniformis TaxID=337506 RepID=UPI003FCE031D
MCGLKSAKDILRKKLKIIIRQLTSEEKQRQSKLVFEKLRDLPQFQESRRVSVYLSTDDEIDTILILKNLFKTNKEVFVPRYKGKQMDMVKLFSMEDYDKLPLTKWNIKQPSVDQPRESALESGGLDLILLPGVAFTKNGKRLGHGMGYYDKFLQSYLKEQKKKPHLIALAFNEQILEDIPTAEHDIHLDYVITESD